MVEVTNELMFEVLKAMQDGMAKMQDTLTEVKGELTAIRTYVYAVHQDIGNIYSILGTHTLRLERIERRLELREPEPA